MQGVGINYINSVNVANAYRTVNVNTSRVDATDANSGFSLALKKATELNVASAVSSSYTTQAKKAQGSYQDTFELSDEMNELLKGNVEDVEAIAQVTGESASSDEEAFDSAESDSNAALSADKETKAVETETTSDETGSTADSMGLKDILLVLMMSMLSGASSSSSSGSSSIGTGSAYLIAIMSLLKALSASETGSSLLSGLTSDSSSTSSLASSALLSSYSSSLTNDSYTSAAVASAYANASSTTQTSTATSDTAAALQSTNNSVNVSNVAQQSISAQSDAFVNSVLNGTGSATGVSSGYSSMMSALTANGLISQVSGNPSYSSSPATTDASTVNKSEITYNGTVVPNSASKPTTPAVTSDTSNRSAQLYRDVIDQFDVEQSYRYSVKTNSSGDASTYCNIFMWDVTSAMGAEIPHYADSDTGAPLRYPNIENANYLNANRISDWLDEYGEEYGWYEVTAEQAQALANKGSPAVTVWKNNSGGHGHVQVVSPSENGTYDESRGVAIAQAGRNLRNYTYIRQIYSSRMAEVRYFAHR